MQHPLRRLVALSAAVPLVALLAACGGDDDDGADDGGGGAGGGGDAISLTGTEFEFDPSSFTAPADTAFTVELTNEGTVEHDFTVDGFEDDKVVAAPGDSASGEFTLGAGTYDFYCSVPGHREAGMEGTLTVE